MITAKSMNGNYCVVKDNKTRILILSIIHERSIATALTYLKRLKLPLYFKRPFSATIPKVVSLETMM